MIIPLSPAAIKELPSFIGVYIFTKKGKILYIGKSINVKVRLLSHIENAKIDKKEELIIKNSDAIECINTDSEFKALLLESKLIRTHLPKYNVRWRDDKSYLYIQITVKDDYPKLLSARRGERDKKSLYFGPFPSRQSVDEIIASLRRIFPFCTQKSISKYPCFHSKIGLCDPCPNLIVAIKDQALKSKMKREYRKNIRQVIKILRGEIDVVEKHLFEAIDRCVEHEDYESAIDLRNKLYRFKRLISQQLFDTDDMGEYNQSEKAVVELHALLQHFIPQLSDIERIECFDMSNLSFKEATASMVVVEDGHLKKSEYRKFRIKNPKARSDFEMIAEVIERRLNNKWKEPDLIVIDGGKPQVRVVMQSLIKSNKSIPTIGIAKNPDRLIIGTDGLPTLRPKVNNRGFSLIRLLRDESHRFAKKYHSHLRSKKLFS